MKQAVDFASRVQVSLQGSRLWRYHAEAKVGVATPLSIQSWQAMALQYAVHHRWGESFPRRACNVESSTIESKATLGGRSATSSCAVARSSLTRRWVVDSAVLSKQGAPGKGAPMNQVVLPLPEHHQEHHSRRNPPKRPDPPSNATPRKYTTPPPAETPRNAPDRSCQGTCHGFESRPSAKPRFGKFVDQVFRRALGRRTAEGRAVVVPIRRYRRSGGAFHGVAVERGLQR